MDGFGRHCVSGFDLEGGGRPGGSEDATPAPAGATRWGIRGPKKLLCSIEMR